MVTIKKNAGLGFYVEATIGTCPTLSATNPLRFTRLVSEDLNSNFSRDTSSEVRGDAQSGGSVVTGVSGAGSISIQHSMETYDDLIAGLLFSFGTPDGDDELSGWKGPDGTYTDPDSAVSNGAANYSLSGDILSLTTGQGALLAAAAGEYVQISGSGNANLDGVWRLDLVSTDDLTLESPNGSETVAQYTGVSGTIATVGMTVTPVAGVAANGVQDRSFGFTRFYSDSSLAGTASTDGLASCDVAVFRGAFITSLQLSVAPGQAGWTGSFSVLHAGEESSTNITSNGQTPLSGFTMANWDDSVAPNTNPLPDAILGVANVKIRKIGVTDGTRIDPLSLNISIGNNSSEVPALRNKGALAVIQGTTTGSIDMEVIYEDSLLHDSMIDDDAYEVEVSIVDSDDKCQMYRFPRCKLTSERPNPGANAPIVQRLTFEAEPGGTDFEGISGAKMVEVLRFYTPAAYT